MGILSLSISEWEKVFNLLGKEDDPETSEDKREIVVLDARGNLAKGKYGEYIWKAKYVDDHWKIKSVIELTTGIKSAISRKINIKLGK